MPVLVEGSTPQDWGPTPLTVDGGSVTIRSYDEAASGGPLNLNDGTLTVDGGGQLWGETWTTGKPAYFGGEDG